MSRFYEHSQMWKDILAWIESPRGRVLKYNGNYNIGTYDDIGMVACTSCSIDELREIYKICNGAGRDKIMVAVLGGRDGL